MQGIISNCKVNVVPILSRPPRVATRHVKVNSHYGDINGVDLDKALQFQLKQASKPKQEEIDSQQANFQEQYEEINEDMKEWIDHYQKTHTVSEDSDHIQNELKDRAKMLITEKEKSGIEKQLQQQNQKNNQNGHPQNGVNKNSLESLNVHSKNDINQNGFVSQNGHPKNGFNQNGFVSQDGRTKNGVVAQNGSLSQNGHTKNGVKKGPTFLKDGSILFTSETLSASQK